jgi:hypothetical protein
MSSRFLRLIAVLGAILVLFACSDSGDPGGAPSPDASAAAIPNPQALLQATAEAGDVSVKVTVSAKMPPAFDDGVPKRRFIGRGVFDRTRDIVGMTYDVSKVPNAAGYLGHIEGGLSVFHGDSRFLVSSPVIARVLPGGVDWLMYDLEDFSRPKALELGIGQLREIGLSDPRLVLSLLAAPQDLVPIGTGTEQGVAVTTYRSEVDLVDAAQSAPRNAATRFSLLREELGVETADVRVSADAEGVVHSIRYSIGYPPSPGSRPVRLRVTVDLVEFGLDARFRVPPERWVTQYDDYIASQ